MSLFKDKSSHLGFRYPRRNGPKQDLFGLKHSSMINRWIHFLAWILYPMPLSCSQRARLGLTKTCEFENGGGSKSGWGRTKKPCRTTSACRFLKSYFYQNSTKKRASRASAMRANGVSLRVGYCYPKGQNPHPGPDPRCPQVLQPHPSHPIIN